MAEPQRRQATGEPDSGRLLTTAMQHALASVVITDTHGRIVYVNPAFERITGYSAAEAIGRRPSILSSGLQTRAYYRRMWETILRGEPWRGELINRRKSGELYDAEVVIAPVRDPDGTVTHFLGTHRELTAENDGFTRTGKLARLLEKRIAARLQRAGKDRRAYTRVELASLVGEVKEELGGAVTIGPLPVVVGNRLLLGDLFGGLLSNALRYAGTPPVVVVEEETGPDVPPGFVRIAVRDNGPGVPVDERDRVFMPFFRGGVREAGRIGLALVRKIVERHGGRVWVDGAPEGGAAFRVLLPAAAPRQAPCHAAGRRGVPPARVLLVEPDPVAAGFVSGALAAGSATAPEVCTVPTAAAALKRAGDLGLDLALVTLDPPDAGGLALLAQLSHEHPGLPLIALAGHGDQRLAVQAMQRGAQDYLTRDEVPALLARAAAAVMERHRAARELEQAKGDMIGIVTHDLKNPVANVVAYVDLLLENGEPLTDRQRGMLGRIRDNALFQLELIGDILDAARIEAGKFKLVKGRHDVKDLVRDALARSEFIAGDKGIALVADLPSEPLVLTLDRGKIMQVLNNLVSNALKFSAAGSTVTVSARACGDAVEVSVRDQGQGIPPGEIEKLFKKFSRTSAKATRGEKSTGLGLYIVSEMVKLHRGAIRVESKPGRGSTFTFTLPVRTDQSR